MAMSQSFRETGSDEANDNVVDICSYCATQDKLQPATHFCFDCGVYGRYICGICERNHKMFLVGHDVKYIGSQANIQRNQRYNQKEILELKKENLEQETHLKQQNQELERRQKYILKLENEVKDLNTQSFSSVWTISPSGNINGSKTLVAAIEIGNMFTKVGFSFQHDYQRCPSEISIIRSLGSNDLVRCSMPTVVLFDENKTFHSFGYEAENNYSELTLDDKHHKWYYFKRFQMELNDDKTELADVNGRTMNTVVVFGAVIKYLKDFLLDDLNKRGTCIQNETYWVLPVPVMWTMFARQIIQQAAYTAGIVGEELTIVSEPEVSSLYCEVLPMDKMKGSNEAKQAITRPGAKYMVINLKEDTADITVHERQADGGLKELNKASSGAWGGTKVDEEFYGLLIRILGRPVYQKFIDDYKEDHLDLQHEFEETRNLSGKVTLKVPVGISATYKEVMDETIKEAIDRSPYCGKITWSGDKMRVDEQIFKNLFKHRCDKIVAHIQDLLKQPDIQRTNIFLMVGGITESVIIQDAVTKAHPRGKFIIPAEDVNTLPVLTGAVIYGHRYLKH